MKLLEKKKSVKEKTEKKGLELDKLKFGKERKKKKTTKNRSSCHETRTPREIHKQRCLGGSLTVQPSFASKSAFSFNMFAIEYVSIECYMLKLSLNAIQIYLF